MRGPSSSTQVSAYLPDWKNHLEFHYLLFLKCIVVTVKKTIYKKINYKIITLLGALLMFLKLFVLLNR